MNTSTLTRLALFEKAVKTNPNISWTNINIDPIWGHKLISSRNSTLPNLILFPGVCLLISKIVDDNEVHTVDCIETTILICISWPCTVGFG